MPTRRPSDDSDDPVSAPSIAEVPWSPDDGVEDSGVDARDVVDDVTATFGAGVPAVVAVVVTCDPGPELEATLDGLVAQAYENLTVLVLDAGSTEDPTPRVAAVAPSAYVKRVPRQRSFGAIANGVFGVIEGAIFYLFVHDDVVLPAGAVQALVTDAFRANAGIVGAKLVDWDDPRRLLDVGSGIDRFGFPVPLCEPGELDQSQHDTPRDVFFVSHAAMLVRSDLFEDLGGFAVDLIGPGEDLDLCWRARLAGARTTMMPDAAARHRGTANVSDPSERAERYGLRNHARTMLVCTATRSIGRVIPEIVVASLADLALCLFTGHWRRIGDIVGAWTWNLLHLPGTLMLRRRVQRSRRVSDEEIRRTFVTGSARLSAYFRGARTAGEGRMPAALAAAREIPSSWQETPVGIGAALLIAVAIVVLFGARGLIGDGIGIFRQFAPFDAAASGFGEWWNGWRHVGVGASGAAPASVPVAALLTTILGGSPALARTLVLVGTLPLGVLGAWRMLRRTAAPPARLVAAGAYLALPLPYNALGSGRLSGLIAYAALPWIVGGLLRISGASPFHMEPVGHRGVVRGVVGTGLIAAVAMAFSPDVAVAASTAGFVVSVVLVVVGRRRSAYRVAIGVVVVSVVAALINLPQALDLLGGGGHRWPLLAGLGATSRRRMEAVDLFSFGGGPYRGAFLVTGIMLGALVVLVGGSAWRLRLGIFGWALIGAGWLGTIAAGRGAESLVHPETMLAVAAVGLSLALAASVEAVTTDLRGGRFGVSQVLVPLAVIGLLLAILPLVVNLWGGRFDAPALDAVSALQTLDRPGAANFRVLWIGDRDTLPMAGWSVREGTVAGLTEQSRPSAGSWSLTEAGPGERAVIDALREAISGGTRRLGRLVAPAAVRYVVVMADGNVTGASTATAPRDSSVADAIATQLDLDPVDIAPGLAVYENPAALSIRSSVPRESLVGLRGRRGRIAAATLLEHDPPASEPALARGADTTDTRGSVPAGELLVSMGSPDDAASWSLRADGRTRRISRSELGWVSSFGSVDASSARLVWSATSSHRLVVIVQLAALGAVAVVGFANRLRSRREETVL